ncbi:hypothetical protein Hypma_010628 [Hypsizygus marmoreus]|uniref:F-box domain-containing protein n=1 Tax=Hypsizygus marmoreus TaxID=39966 RepID=A0A369JU59_HYPMA|nr:hypothetical protein Hypma_010628 [Hypsizygus marmoreus]
MNAVKSRKYAENDHSKRLPAELLSEVFLLCQPTDRSIRGFNRTPFMLGHICQQWRHVAFQLTPRLWTHLDLASSKCGNAEDMSLLSQWVERARPYKANLSIWFYDASSHLWSSKSTPLDDIPLPKFLLPSRLQGVENMDLELPLRSFKQLAAES